MSTQLDDDWVRRMFTGTLLANNQMMPGCGDYLQVH